MSVSIAAAAAFTVAGCSNDDKSDDTKTEIKTEVETTSVDSSSTTTGGSSTSSLTADVPTPAGATLVSTTDIQEGGVNLYYTAPGGGESILSSYQTTLTAAGWTIQGSGGGGNGGGFQATNGGRYLSFNEGGTDAETYINTCVWPSQPSDDNCGNNN